jgi:beta-glucanase (GH16 family)
VVNLRVDNEGDHNTKPWNTESAKVDPGKTVPIKVVFGYHYGYRPGFSLNPAAIKQLVFFTNKTEVPLTFRVDSIVAGGNPGETPAVDPRTIRIHPPEGYLLGGAGAKIDPATQAKPSTGVKVEASEKGGQQQLEFTLSEGENRYVTLAPVQGFWNLSRSTEVQVKFTNTGSRPISPVVQLANNGADERTDEFTLESLAAGASAVLSVPYVPKAKWAGPADLSTPASRKGKGATKFASDKVAKIILRFPGEPKETSLRVDSIRAVVVGKKTPEWLGQRPPVEGTWTKTLDENFDGDKINDKIWDVTGPNYWGQKKLTHWSRDNVTVADGNATIRLEKRPGPHNDDPASTHSSDYAGGILRSYDKWTQLYGYFETRVKLPEKTAMWPAFWLMPDRGAAAGDVYKRESTGGKGMEFDIMEHLTRWGPYRYTTAIHWDGYGKEHKVTGAGVYFNPDPDGYVTAGLLWLPGLAVFYCNGEEVGRWENDRICAEPSSILYTMPIGGWDNESAPVDSELPAEFKIDYVRVWQRADLKGAAQ